MRLIVSFLFFLALPSLAMADLIGKPALDAVLVNTDGTKSSFLAASPGKKTIVIFWATWCPHCYEELGGVYQALDVFDKKGVKIILVDMGEGLDDVRNYFKQRQMKWSSFVDSDYTLQGPYRLEGVPTLIFIDDKGIIRSIHHSFPPHFEQYFS